MKVGRSVARSCQAGVYGMLTGILLDSIFSCATIAAAATPQLAADANCDARPSAADFVAAIIVSGDETQFPSCADADPFRGHALNDGDFLPILHDIFGTFTARWTPTPTRSRTATRTGTVTRTPTPTVPTPALPTRTPSFSPTPSPTASATFTATVTPTSAPTNSPTRRPTRTPTQTRIPTPTATPTGVAFQLSGKWFADWTNQYCFLNGKAFVPLADTTYLVTALDGQLDITDTATGDRIGRGLMLQPDGRVETHFSKGSGMFCVLTGTDKVEELFDYDYTFTFHTNGTGTAMVTWSYGANTFCATCTVTDTAGLTRVAGPVLQQPAQ